MHQDLASLRAMARAEAAKGGMSVDIAAYDRYERDPLEPLILSLIHI